MATFVSNSQFLATLSTTSSEHTATISSSHSLKETMFVTTLALRWLECTFHSVIVCIYALSRGRVMLIYELKFTHYELFGAKIGCKGTAFF